MPEVDPMVPLEPMPLDEYQTFAASQEKKDMIEEVMALRTLYFGKDEDRFRKLDSLLTVLNII